VIENDQLYAETCFPLKIRSVAGIRLKPFSVGHWQLLQSLNSPFLDFRSPEYKDFMAALWICSRPVVPNENTSLQKLPLYWKFIAGRLHKIADKEPVRFWGLIEKIQAYIFEPLFFKPPIVKKNTQLYRQSSCPDALPMIRSLMNHFRYSEAEVLNMPLMKAKMQHAGWLEHEGALEFQTKADTDIIDRLKSPEFAAWDKKVRAEAALRLAAKKKK
jgi:hypothetical protein